jgi:peptidoglycan/LPS O-acetylase OafA/YrhL
VVLSTSGNIGPVARQDTFVATLQTGLRGTLILLVVCAPLWLQRPFANRITDRLADLSYGVYLIHWVLVLYLHEFTDLPAGGSLLDLTIWVAVVVPPSLLFASLSRRWLELPISAWVRRRLDASPRLDRPVAADAPARS